MTESQNIVGLYDIFQEVQKRPTLYLSRASIFDLLSFCSGYSIARRSLKLPMSKQEQDFQEFTQWLQNKFEIKANRSWAMIILFHSADETDALREFFSLLEEFKNRGNSRGDRQNSTLG